MTERSQIGGVLLLTVCCVALLHAGTSWVSSNDLHIYLASGRWMAEHGALLETETFSWTAPGVPFQNGTWGFSAWTWALHELGGLQLLRIVNALAVTVALGLIGWSAPGDGRAGAVAALVAWLLVLQNLAVRGQTLCYALFAGLIATTGRVHWGASVAIGAAIGAAWANLHGSFPAALVWLGLLGAGAAWERDWVRAKRFGAAATGLGVGTLANPYGPGLWRYVGDNSSLPVERGFTEWLPPEIWAFEGARFYGAVALWGVLLALSLRGSSGTIRQRTGLGPGEWAVVLAFGFLAARGIRFVAWFGLATAPLLAQRLAWRMPAPRPLSPRTVQVAWGGAVLFWAALLGKGLREPAQLKPDCPVAAVDALEDALDGASVRMLNTPETGGYLVFRMPGVQVSGDVRTWIYDDDAWAVYLDLVRAPPDWAAQLDAAHVDAMLLEQGRDQALIDAGTASPAWRLVYADTVAAAFVRAAR